MFWRWIEAERGRFMLLLPVAMGAAILGYFALPFEPPLWTGILGLLLTALALAVSWRHMLLRFLALLALSAALGLARAEWRTADEPPMRIMPIGPVTLSGTIARIEQLPDAARITLVSPRIDAGPILPRAIRLKLRPGERLALKAGQGVQAYAILFGPERPAWPGGWDMERDYFFSGLNASGFALTPLTLTRVAPRNRLADGLQNVRNDITGTILATLPRATGGIAVTLLTGDEQAIPPPERQEFVEAGLAHILAVAGLHVGIVMGLVFWSTRWLLTRHTLLALHLPVKSIAAAAALLGGIGYAALTGAHLPILRSLAMAALATLGVFAGRRAFSLRGLAIAALALLLASPEVILSTSFQMSFSAVAALISGYAAMQQRAPRIRTPHSQAAKLGRHVLGLAFTSLLAGGASMPFAAYQFQQIQPYWIPANLLAVPLTAFWIMPCGLLALALMPVHLAALALVPMGWGIAAIVRVTQFITTWPDALLQSKPMPASAILFIAAGLAWLCIWRSAGRFAGVPVIALGLVIALSARPPDVLVSADSRLIALRSGETVFLVRAAKADNFTLAQWRTVWGGTPLTPAGCTAASCRVGAAWYTTVPVCVPARLIVAPIEMPACAAPVIDRFATYRQGAVAAWITPDGVRRRTDRQVQGVRPWVLPYPQL